MTSTNKSISYYPKLFCHIHSNVIGFLSASLIICICFIALLPRVHESFKSDAEKQVHDFVSPYESEHNHQTPIGEIIICSGFLLFYCIGLYLDGSLRDAESRWLDTRRDSTICCSSTRCPTSKLPNGSHMDSTIAIAQEVTFSQLSIMETTSLITAKNPEDDCVLLLNRHHNHHMHTRHHEHKSPRQSKSILKYGSTSWKLDDNQDTKSIVEGPTKHSPEIPQRYIDITLLPPHEDDRYDTKYMDWPRYIKITLLCLILAGLMIALDLQLQGLLEAIKVFRAAATGALLYSAFFLILPKERAGCNFCEDDDSN